jgi:hypothetical protein
MNEFEILARILDECKEAGLDPKEVIQQCSSNLTLKEQNAALTEINNQIHHRIDADMEEERIALNERDDAHEAKKKAKTELNSTLTELADTLQTKPEVQEIRRKLEIVKKDFAQLEREKETMERFLAPARWVRGVLGKEPELLRKHYDHILHFLDQPAAEQPYTDEVEHEILNLIIDQLIRYKSLVTKTEYVRASLAADNLKWQVKFSVTTFLQHPEKLTIEQRRQLLAAFKEAGLTKDNFEAYMEQVAISWRKCPIHKVDLKVNSNLKFCCTHPGCTYME